jgi:hypothetical protein
VAPGPSLFTFAHGFTASGGGGNRGETVECTNGFTLITVSADWLAGELSMSVQRAGGSPVPIEDVLDLGKIKDLHLRRLGRSVSAAAVETNLRKIAHALDEQAPDLLTSDA